MEKVDYKKEFCRQLEVFNYKYSRWDVWKDFLYVAAVSMVNTVPVKEREQREEQYLKIINKYTSKEQEALIEMFKLVILAFEENPEQDFLGEMYHHLKLHQHQKGQFFTPYHICHFMSELNFSDNDMKDKLDEKGYITVNDPACGAGALLIAFANVCRQHKINFQEKVLFIAQDIDLTAALMCYIQLSLLGCNAVIIVGNSLLKPNFHPDNEVWLTPMYFLNEWRFKKFFEDEEGGETGYVELEQDKDGQLQIKFEIGGE